MSTAKKSAATKQAKPPKQGSLPLPAEMQRVHLGSRPNRIAELIVGESDAMAVRLDMDDITRQVIEEEKTRLTSVMSKAASQAAKRSGNKYVTELGDFMTRSGDLILTAAVTRIA